MSSEALRHINAALKITKDPRLEKIQRRLRATPMSKILAKVPGVWTEKARRIGVTRQTLYLWTRGETRPSNVQARKLAKLTGFSYAEIRGLDA